MYKFLVYVKKAHLYIILIWYLFCFNFKTHASILEYNIFIQNYLLLSSLLDFFAKNHFHINKLTLII
jgi:hypothetical protein